VKTFIQASLHWICSGSFNQCSLQLTGATESYFHKESRSAEQLHSRLTELVQKNLIICSKYIYITY